MCQKWISRKIWMTEKSWNFHTVYYVPDPPPIIGGLYFLKLLASKRIWLFSKKQFSTRWLILMVGLKTIETFCMVILLNLSRSMTCPIWTKIQFKRVRLASGKDAMSIFIPSIRFWGLELAETCSNFGIKLSVRTGSGNSRRYWKMRKVIVNLGFYFQRHFHLLSNQWVVWRQIA